MKKRLLSALLALALVFVLLPTTALAGETTGKEDYDISINGKGWKFERDNTSGAYIPVYYYHTGVFDNANNKNRTNDNLELTKKDNTVTITIRRGTSHDHRVYPIEFTLEKISTTSGEPYDYTPCIKMGNNNNLVITGKGTLNITRDEKNGIGAALCSEVGDITITDGITVKANFLKQVSKSTVGNAISVKDHNLIISGKNTKVEARNSSCNFQDLYDVSATVCVENGEIKVSDGATLNAANSYTNPTGPTDPANPRYSYYSRAISGSSSKPCALTVTGENSCVIAETDNSLGKAYGHVNFSIDGAKIEVGTSSPAQTITDINNIKNYKYAKISVPALQKTSDVYIAGGPAVVGQWTTITANSCSGSYYYDAAKKELTLKGVNITRNNNKINHAIQFTKNGDYTINLEGTNNISSVTNGICALNGAFYDNPANISVTITGTGSLNVTANTYAIDMQVGDLIFNSTGNITLTTNRDYRTNTLNALHVAGSISIDNTKYDIVGKRQDAAETTETISDSSEFDPAYLNGYTVGGETTLFKTITITPAAAKPSTISYGGTTLKQGETIYGETSGTATVDRENNTITLNNFKGDKALVFNAESTPNSITLIGDSTLSAVETKYQSLTISGSGSGSLTVGSIKVHKEKSTSTTGNTIPNLTINGATVTVGNAEITDRAIDIDGDLTVTNGSLTATSKSDSVPTVQVGGNASFTGSTVTITNNSTTQGKSGEYSYAVSTGLYVGGTLDIKNAAKVTSTVIGGNAIYAKGDITISGDGTKVEAQNSAYKFSAISTNGTVNISDNSTVKAENGKKHQGDPTGVTDPSTGKTYNACPAITGKIANKNTQNKLHIAGFTTSSAGSQNPTEGTPLIFDIDPSSAEPYIHHYKVTITRGDEVTRTNSPVVIAGTTLLNDTYYTITNGSKVAEGTDSSNYNAFYDSETKTLKLNNAKISTTTKNAAIKISEDLTITVTGTNELKGNYNHCIESYNNFTINGTGTLNMTNTNSSSSAASVIYCGPYKNLTIAAEVIIKNEAQPGNLIFTVEENACSFAEGYNVYASTNVSGSPLEAYDAAKGSTYKYLRVTKENLAPTPPTTYTVTITGENISKYYSSEGELEQTVTAGEAIKTVTVAANGGYYFPDNYVKDLELPSGITATVSGDNWYLTIKGIPSKGATINLPVLSKRPTITVDIPLPVAGNKPATIDQIHLTCDDPNYTPEITGIRWNKGSLTEESVAIGANDTFVAGTCYNVKIFLSSGIADGAYKLAYAGGGDNPWYAYWGTSNFQLYFQATPAATHTHEKGDLQFNSEGHWYKCAADTSCTERIDFASHTYKDNICTVCNYVKPACSHTNLKYIDNNDYETHKVQCADCEEIIAEKEAHDIQGYFIDDVTGTHQEFCNKCHYRGPALHHSIIYVPKDNGHCKACAICKVQLGRVEEHTFENGVCTVCNATSGEIVPPTPDNPGTIVIIRPAEEEKPAQQPNPSTGANDLVGLAVAAAVAAALGSAALLRKHD